MKQHLVTTAQAAEYLGVKKNTMEGWRIQGVGPRYIKVQRLVKYKTEDLDSWLAAQTRQSTSQAKGA